jgi:CDP-2,3-bis-(O-geranylgeranyl)-sn-glycerol synthase
VVAPNGLLFYTILYPIIYIFPAYAANGAPVLFGAGRPLDFGRKFRGKRIFGDNKTRRGTLSAIVVGILTGVIYIQFKALAYMLPIAIMLTAGAIFGDLFGSFIKRQLGHKPGKGIPILDQYGFYVFALVFALPFGNLPDAYGLIFITVLTGILHPLTNALAHGLKLKEVPW